MHPKRNSAVCSARRTYFRCLCLLIVAPLALSTPLFARPKGGPQTSSSPIAITSDDRHVWVVNPDNDSVSVIDVHRDANRKLDEIAVGEGPRFLAISEKNHLVFVSNSRSGTVTVIRGASRKVLCTTTVGAEPAGLAVTPGGDFVYVANFGSDDVSVLDARTRRFLLTISGVGPKPRAIAITDDKVYVTHFLAELRNDSRTVVEKEGRDDGKEGRVTIISRASNQVIGTVVLHPLANTGFNSNGSVLDRIPATDPPTFTFPTGCFPNLLENIVVKGNDAYLPNVGSSPNGPVRFNVNVQGLVAVFDTTTDTDSGQTINLNRGVGFEPVGKKIFHNPPTALLGPTDPDPIIRVEIGTNDQPGEPQNSNPQGIAINSADTRAYVFNFISRDVSVVDISGDPASYAEIDRIVSATLPTPGTLAAIIHRGNELFNTSIGPAGTQDNARPPAGRLSDF